MSNITATSKGTMIKIIIVKDNEIKKCKAADDTDIDCIYYDQNDGHITIVPLINTDGMLEYIKELTDRDPDYRARTPILFIDSINHRWNYLDFMDNKE